MDSTSSSNQYYLGWKEWGDTRDLWTREETWRRILRSSNNYSRLGNSGSWLESKIKERKVAVLMFIFCLKAVKLNLRFKLSAKYLTRQNRVKNLTQGITCSLLLIINAFCKFLLRWRIQLILPIFTMLYASLIKLKTLKGSDRLCKVVELSMQTNSLGFIWDIWNGYKIYKSWVWAKSWRSNLVLLGGYVFGIGFFFKLLNNDDEK